MVAGVVVVGWKLVVFYAARQYRTWWRHFAFADLYRLTAAATVSVILLMALRQFGWLPGSPARSVLLLDFMVTVMLVGGLRCSWRAGEELMSPIWQRTRYRRALLVGASPTDKLLALHLQLRPELPFRICGHVDENSRWLGHSFGGVSVLGAIIDLTEIAAKNGTTDIIAITGSLSGKRMQFVRQKCEAAGLTLHLIPPLSQLLSEHQQLPLRPIEVDKLLQRPTVKLDELGIRGTIAGKVIAVTGAGGSIGSEICRQLLAFHPAKMILVDQSEPSLYSIDMEMRRLKSATQIVPFLGDCTDSVRMSTLFRTHQPDVVFHVAAHKHVPMLESHVGEAVKNNVFGTANLVELSEQFGVAQFVYISTDKAVKPTSIMGVTKHLAERYVLAMAEEGAGRYVAVRFGNVLGSAGSVVPLFQEQIRRGGPITITHPDMERFFMTTAEAAQLVLQANALGKGGEIFVLDMGEPVKIVDLAREMIRMSGLPEHAIDITFCGTRPGEKLYEELYFDDEVRLPTPHQKLFSAQHRPIARTTMLRCLEELHPLVDGDQEELIDALQRWVPEYRRTPAGAVIAKPSEQSVPLSPQRIERWEIKAPLTAESPVSQSSLKSH